MIKFRKSTDDAMLFKVHFYRTVFLTLSLFTLDKKSEVAVHCLLVMVRPPPKRGIKKPLPSPYELLRALYRTFHVSQNFVSVPDVSSVRLMYGTYNKCKISHEPLRYF